MLFLTEIYIKKCHLSHFNFVGHICLKGLTAITELAHSKLKKKDRKEGKREYRQMKDNIRWKGKK